MIQKERSNPHIFKRDFLSNNVRDFLFQELLDSWVFGGFDIPDILQVAEKRHRFRVDHRRAEPSIPIFLLDIQVGGRPTQLRLEILQREHVSRVQVTQPEMDH